MNAYQRRKERRDMKRHAAAIQKIVDRFPKPVDLLTKAMRDAIERLPKPLLPGRYNIYPKG